MTHVTHPKMVSHLTHDPPPISISDRRTPQEESYTIHSLCAWIIKLSIVSWSDDAANTRQKHAATANYAVSAVKLCKINFVKTSSLNFHRLWKRLAQRWQTGWIYATSLQWNTCRKWYMRMTNRMVTYAWWRHVTRFRRAPVRASREGLGFWLLFL